MRVLYVEDDQSVAKAVEAMLASEAFECDTTDSGKRAVDLAKSNRYDVILLDLMLPDIDGYEVIKRLREAGVRTPFLMQTGITDHDNQFDGRPFGVTEYLVKPFNKTDLIERVQAVLSRPKLTPVKDFVAEPESGDTAQSRPDEERSDERFESMQIGKILLNEGIDCLILNMSNGGAAIELPDPDMHCPPAFDLQLPSGSILRSRLCWRFQDKLGVKGEIIGTHNGNGAVVPSPATADPDDAAASEPAPEIATAHQADRDAIELDALEEQAPTTSEEPRPEVPSIVLQEPSVAPPEPSQVTEQEASAPNGLPEDDRAAADDTFIIARGVRLSADSCECTEVLVDGVFESAIQAKRLRVSAGGRFVGRAVVEEAEIAGSIEGDLIVHGRLTVTATGTVTGRTQCREMEIELGGFIAGLVQRPATCAPENPIPSASASAPAQGVVTVA